MAEIRNPNEQEQALKKKVLEEALNARARMFIKHPFTAMLAMRLEMVTVVDSRLPTACTDGNAIYLNANFFDGLKAGERIYLLAHEIWHCVFQHFRRRGSRDRKKFNYASDLEIDFMLKDQGFEVFEILPHEESWIGKSAEQIYELLPDDVERPENADVHIYEGERHDENPKPEGAPIESDQNDQGSGQIQTESGSGNASDDGEDNVVIDPDYVPGVLPGTERKWREWIVGAAQQVKRNRGTLPAGVEHLIESYYKPQLSWREILQQFVTSCFGGQRRWLPPNRRYISSGLYLPSRKDEFLSIVVAVDTSGSTMNDLPQFLAELKGIVASFGRYEVTLIECDAEIQSVKTYTEWEPFEEKEYKFSGFGGTSFVPVLDYYKEQIEEPKLLIYLTDGFGDAPERPPNYPVMWVLTSDGKPPAEWGWVARYHQQKAS